MGSKQRTVEGRCDERSFDKSSRNKSGEKVWSVMDGSKSKCREQVNHSAAFICIIPLTDWSLV